MKVVGQEHDLCLHALSIFLEYLLKNQMSRPGLTLFITVKLQSFMYCCLVNKLALMYRYNGTS